MMLIFFLSCKKEVIEDMQPIPADEVGVNVDLALVPFAKLSDYRFFVGDLVNHQPNEGLVYYEPASQLFTDYAQKKRFLWIPKGTKMNYTADDELLEMPVGTALVKTFYYDNVLPSGSTKIIETRVMIRKQSGWVFAEYVWNNEQTEAYLSMNGSYQSIQWIQNGENMSANYRIPSEIECLICHKDHNSAIPIGLKPQNLNRDIEVDGELVNQLYSLIQQGKLNDNLPSNIVSTINYMDHNQPLHLRVRSYLDMNCAHCHREGSHCDYRPLRLGFSETDLSSNLGVCVEPDENIDPVLLYLVAPNNIARSVMHFRMNTNDENYRMPLLGRSVVHAEGVTLIEEWINELTEICN
jgi:uncharacterized repeat protein (TIGR03806 family)